ncbi:hypothetical protein F2Q68_00044323 [Brassica cretica]|uniref:Uncharacterized protein n=1 Tax=Brassica cretica TaxID=69181 RepID=A0A8S9LLG5_BRACR|nr:hypothetical protein F2Q68_00044323 [Brassica cretica]
MKLSSWYDGWKFGSYRYSEDPECSGALLIVRHLPTFTCIGHGRATPRDKEIALDQSVGPRNDKGIALEDINFVSEDLPLPGWNPGFTPGDGSGTSEAPLPDDFFANLPPGFTTPASLDEA